MPFFATVSPESDSDHVALFAAQSPLYSMRLDKHCLLRLSAAWRSRYGCQCFWLRVEPYVDSDWRANVQKSQAPRKIFERGALWQYKEQRAICEKRSDAAWVWLFMDASHRVPPVLRRQRFVG